MTLFQQTIVDTYCVLNTVASYFIASIFSLLIVKHATIKHVNVDKSYHRAWGPRLARWSIQALLTLREDRQNR